MNAKLEKQIAKTAEKMDRLQEQKKLSDAREAAKKKEADRKIDSRRKILIGAAMLYLVKTNEMSDDKLMAMVERGLTKKEDREFFKLPPKQQSDLF